nr:tail fiber assembly protein [Rahnella laticis]
MLAVEVKEGVIVEIGYTYVDGNFTAPAIPEPTHDELVLEATQTKEQLRTTADNTIDPLSDAVDLGIATDAETASLKEWKTYRVLLNRVNPNDAPNISWPDAPQ